MCRTAWPTAQGRLPQEIKNTGVTITKANPNFVFAAGFYSPDDSLSNQYISNYLDVYVKDALKRIPGRRRRGHLRRAQVCDAHLA